MSDGLSPAAPKPAADTDAARELTRARQSLMGAARRLKARYERTGHDVSLCTDETREVCRSVSALESAEQAVKAAPPNRTDSAGQDALEQVLIRVFGKAPSPTELATWTGRLNGAGSVADFLNHLVRSPAFEANRCKPARYPAGHFFSPVVNPELVEPYVRRGRAARAKDIAGIALDLDGMEAFWRAHEGFIVATPFTERPDGVHRYCYGDGPYDPGDAVALRAMIAAHRPSRIVEIGSGFSTACMLDTADEIGLHDLRITCIEPFPQRLRSILRPGDEARITILEQDAQQVPLSVFSELGSGDILFIDSTHVLKTGSDVHYQLFHILPLLPAGVLIHVHDCRWPFEYSDIQIFEKNYSWNEVYGIRALLMYSTRFGVEFCGSLFAQERPAAAAACAPFMVNPGSALWMKVLTG